MLLVSGLLIGLRELLDIFFSSSYNKNKQSEFFCRRENLSLLLFSCPAILCMNEDDHPRFAFCFFFSYNSH